MHALPLPVCGDTAHDHAAQRSALAAETAAAAGLPADRLYTLDGGTDAWRKAGHPVE